MRFFLSCTHDDYEIIEAAQIVTHTHIYQIIKDENIISYNEEKYYRTFASQSRGGIELTSSSFDGDWKSLTINVVKGIIKGTKDQVWPNIVCR